MDSSGTGQYCGNGQFAELAIFSFHPVKHIATGEGGMITTNSKELYEKLLILRTHGITRDAALFKNELSFAAASDTATGNYPGWYMEMQTLGFNYRISDFQAALGTSQLKRASQGIEKRRMIARRYDQAFANHPSITSQLNELKTTPSGHAYHLYVIQARRRLELYNFLRERGIYTQVHYIPAHLMPYYKSFGWKEGDMPFAEEYYRGCLSLPIFPSLSAEDQQFVIDSIDDFYCAS